MKFADANIFLYAFLEPKKKMAGKQSSLRQESKNIVTRIEKGERVITSVVQLSEISNILEARTSRKFSREIMESMLLNENIEIIEVSKELYAAALELAKIYDISINDCIAIEVMKINNIKEIYSFDSDFDKADGIKRIMH